MIDFLLWLMGGLGSTFVASYFLERWNWFQKQTFETKRFLSTVIASVITVLAYITVTYVPPSFWEALSPYWQLVIGVITVNYGKQMFHKYDKTLPQ